MFTFFLSGFVGWIVNRASYQSKSVNVETQDNIVGDLFFRPTGTEMYIVGSQNDNVYQYTLSTAWDVNTASYASKSANIAGQETGPNGLFFKHDGTSMYIVGNVNQAVYQYTLSTAWDASTASYASKSASVSSEDIFPTAVFFKEDGLKMYVLGNTNSTIYQYTLSTAWDVSTASYASKSFSVSSQENNVEGLFFKVDGSLVYIVGRTSDTVYQYNLSTAWDISTASYKSVSFSVSTEDTLPVGLFFKHDGMNMYMIGTTSPDTVFQYEIK